MAQLSPYTMQIKELAITELHEYENNPRNNDGAVNAVAASIEEFGFKVPIIIDSDNTIVAGHTQLKAAKKLGYDVVPCIVADDLTPAPDYWTNQEAFQTVLGSTPRILAASLIAFVAGDFVNDKVFKRMKAKHENMKGFAWRAILSSFCGEIVDSAIFIPIAFIGQMPFETLVIMGITQVCLKVAYEIVIIPLTTWITKKVAAQEAKADAA